MHAIATPRENYARCFMGKTAVEEAASLRFRFGPDAVLQARHLERAFTADSRRVPASFYAAVAAQLEAAAN